MALTSSITAYDPRWPQCYAEAAGQLAPILEPSLVAIHHVGSTAVPLLAAKPEIDILAIVRTSDTPDSWLDSLGMLGFRRGGDLSPGHRFFKRDADGVRTHKVHLCTAGHPSITEMLGFRDHLRISEEDRRSYEDLKLRLERENVAGIGEYLSRKRPFITGVLAQIGITR
ncbi:GrpB family protein [Phenylobacterium sp.]|uniref:GrpB family protein n=1 Tax=Phenylobacterium sp. TaxID=1871053 RepID=UPI00286E56E9|nr:GrpB family protein [Phenylobacterium sp.]